MENTELPLTAFTNPFGTNQEQILALSKKVFEQVFDMLGSAASRAPLPSSLPDFDSLTLFPDTALGENRILENLQLAMDSAMNPGLPGYIGHMDSLPATFSILGEFASSALNNNMLSLEMAPFFARLETLLTREFATLFELGELAGGVMTSGGSLANLEALAVARNYFFESLEKGIINLSSKPVIFASEVAHASLEKASMLLGLGTKAVVKVATNANSQMDTQDLKVKLENSLKQGEYPFCIVATAGTTTTGSIDPIAQIAQIAQEYKLWLHVDAAYGGAIMLSPLHQNKLAGIEHANSITFNPQKWLYVAKTCAMVLFKNFGLLEKTFRVGAPYMADTKGFTNLGELGVQGTRHAEVLKLWLTLQHIGREGYTGLINRSFELTNYFVEQVKARPYLKLAGECDSNLICFRAEPEWLMVEKWDEWNSRLQQHLLQNHFFLSLPLYRGQRWLRAVLLNPYTDEKTLDKLFSLIAGFSKEQDLNP